MNIMYSRDVEFTKDNSEYQRDQCMHDQIKVKKDKRVAIVRNDHSVKPSFIDDLKSTKTNFQLRKSVRKMKLYQTAKEVHDKFLANNYEYLKKKTIQQQNIKQAVKRVINIQKFEKAAKEKQDIKLKNYNECFRQENFNSNYLYNNLPKDTTNEMRIVVNKNELMKRKIQQNQGLETKRSIVVLNDDERENNRRYAFRNSIAFNSS